MHPRQCQHSLSNQTISLKLPLSRNEYLCFQADGRTARACQCAKSRALTKFIETIMSIGSFEHKCVILEALLKSQQLKEHTLTIGVDQSLSNSDLYEHRRL